MCDQILISLSKKSVATCCDIAEHQNQHPGTCWPIFTLQPIIWQQFPCSYRNKVCCIGHALSHHEKIHEGEGFNRAKCGLRLLVRKTCWCITGTEHTLPVESAERLHCKNVHERGCNGKQTLKADKGED